MKRLIFILTILIAHTVTAQKKQLEYAKKYATQNNFLKVETHLLKAYKQKASQETALLLARNYIKLHDDKNTCQWYKTATSYGNILSSDKLHYAYALTKTENYELAKIWFEKYVEESPNHDVAHNYLKQLSKIEQLYSDSSMFKIHTSVLNTSENEYAAYAVEGGMYYIQTRGSGFLAKRFSETQQAYDDIHFYDFATKETSRMKGQSNSPYHEGPMCILPDRKTMYFTRNKVKEHNKIKGQDNEIVFDIYCCKLKENNKWGKAEKVIFDEEFKTVGHPYVTNDNKTMFFAAEKEGQQHPDLYVAQNVNGIWSNIKPLNQKCNTSGTEAFPYFLESRNMLFFSSDGLGGLGGLDIYVAYLDADFEVTRVKNVGAPMNSYSDDFSINFTNDFNGHFATNRMGSDDIYAFSYTPRNIEIKGTVVDINTKLPIPFAQVSIQTEDTESNYILTDENGKFTTYLDSCRVYEIHYSKQYYQSEIDTMQFGSKLHEVVLYKELKPSVHQLSVVVLDKKTQLPYPKKDVVLTINNLTTGDIETLAIDNLGETSLELDQESEYLIVAQRQGNFKRSESVTTIGSESSSQRVVFELEEIEIGKAIVLNEIYYDFNSANLRSDSKNELENLANMLQDNPKLSIEIGSHTDIRGSDEYNLKLSQSRSESTVQYLIDLGIAPNRIVAKGYGEQVPINDCSANQYCTEEDHQVNRRTEFKVIKID